MIVADSGAIYALYDADDKHHGTVRDAFSDLRETVHLPVACLGEIDYLLRARLGVRAELDFLAEVRNGRFLLEPLDVHTIARCSSLLEQYAKLDLGLADASVIATAERLRTLRVLTVDRRDFETVRTVRGECFTIVPCAFDKARTHRRTAKPK